jgi:tetrapyrrole methylase family protein / MazG family protein
MSALALQALESSEKLMFRTAMHPAARDLADRGLRFETFDSVYESASDFAQVYETIAFKIMGEAREGDVTYAVPGHPLVAERSVALIIKLAAAEEIPVRIAPSQSFIEACLEALAVSVDKGLKLIDALAISETLPSTDCPNLIYQVYDRLIASEVKLALMEVYPDEFEVYVISGAGGGDSNIAKIPLYMMDRREYDHLTSVFIGARGQGTGAG